MSIIYALASVATIALIVGIAIGIPMGGRLRVLRAEKAAPQMSAYVSGLLEDTHRELDEETYGDVPHIPFRGSAR